MLCFCAPDAANEGRQWIVTVTMCRIYCRDELSFFFWRLLLNMKSENDDKPEAHDNEDSVSLKKK